MRIIHVMPGIGMGGGAEQSFAMTAPGLIERGHELHLALLTERRALVPQLESVGVVVHDLHHHRGMVGNARQIRNLVHELRPDVVHASLYQATAPTQLGLRGVDVPVLITWTAMTYGKERRAEVGISHWRLEGIRRIEQALARWRPSHYQAVTQGVARSYGSAIGIPSERIHVAGRGRPAAPPRDADRCAATRASLGIAGDQFVILCTARHDPRKGLLRIVSCFDEIVDRVPNAHLVVAGAEGPATPALRSALEGARFPDRVHLLGFRADVPELLEAADAFAVTSHSEGACGSALEAMARGLPIVSARLDGLEGVLVDGTNALLVDGNRAGAFIDPVVRIAQDQALAASIGAAGLETFSERFTVRRSLDALEDLYRLIVDSPVGPGSR